MHSRSVAFEGAVVGDGTGVGEGAMIGQHRREDLAQQGGRRTGATVNHSIIWGSQGRHVCCLAATA